MSQTDIDRLFETWLDTRDAKEALRIGYWLVGWIKAGGCEPNHSAYDRADFFLTVELS